MTDSAFIATGWIGTAFAFVTYALSVRRRTRHAITVAKRGVR